MGKIEIKEEFEKILHAIHQNRNLLCHPDYPKTTGFDDTRITAENLADLAGNHIFDDHPEWFGITKQEGHKIRTYFQTGAITRNYDYIVELHSEFPSLIEQERQEHLDWVNQRRKRRGLQIISF